MKVLMLFAWLLPAALSASCGGTYKGFQHTLTSPNYPQDYPDKSHCVYVLEGDATDECEQEFHLQFLDFDVRGSENCREDYLQVGEKHVFCGSVFGLRRFVGKNNTLRVIFHSDGRDTSKGFKIIVSAVPCSLKLSPLKDGSRDFAKTGRSSGVFYDPYRRGIRQGGEGTSNADNSTKAIQLPALSTNDVSDGSPESFQLNAAIGQQQQESTWIDSPAQDNKPGIDVPPSLSPGRITSYLFLPPTESNATTFNVIGDKVYETVPSPPTELLPPSDRPAADFSKSQFPHNIQAALDKSSTLTNRAQQASSLPARSYGEPGQVVDYDLSVTAADCDRTQQHFHDKGSDRINYDSLGGYSGGGYPGQGYPGGGGFTTSSGFVYDPRFGIVGGNNYPGVGYNPGGLNYPGGNYNPDLGIAPNYPNGGYNPAVGIPNYPIGGSNPGWGLPTYPNEGYNPSLGSGYNPGFVPSYNPALGGGNYYPGYGNGLNNGLVTQGGECCRIPAARRFTIASPGFPGSLSTSNYACRYTITKYTSDVCRLRLVFRFFNFGAEDQYCSYGYVEIDGRRYCGCKSGQSIQVLFTSYIAKTIFVVYTGLPRSKFTGFLIDVIQEPCGIGGLNQLNPSYPSNPYDLNGLGFNNYQNYYQRRVDAPNDTAEVEGAKKPDTIVLPSAEDPNPHIRSRRDVGYSYSKPNVPFVDGDIPVAPFPAAAGELNERFFGGNCESRLFLDWAFASKEAILTNQRCSANPGFNSRRAYLPPSNRRVGPSCEEINVNQGFLKSPLYPNRYPGNVQKCYRFNKAANACRLKLYVQDFDLEPSQGCAKDYLLFSGEDKRYCGRALSNYKNVFDLARVNFVEVYFSTDSDGAGRGFNIGFTQLPCEASANF